MAALLCACQGPAPGTSYFPLDAGHRWRYDLATEREAGGVEHEELVLETLGQQEFAGQPAWVRRSETGVDYFLRADASGIYRVASRLDVEAEPLKDAAPRYVLKAPLKVGTEWQADTNAYVLQRRQEFPPEIRNTHAPVMMTYTIAALGQGVDTRAGHFGDCLRVNGRALLRLFADAVSGWRDLPLTTTEWYCKGVGLVKVVREEPANSTFLSGGTMTLELTEWK
ncbi:MAG: hypothetical protein KGL43_16390 [Burkholderiales bacterium]|nr:hypothetical protein [Burkholderiales bacterium]